MKMNQVENRISGSESEDQAATAGYSAWTPTAQVDFSKTLNRHIKRDPQVDDLTMIHFGFSAANNLLVA